MKTKGAKTGYDMYFRAKATRSQGKAVGGKRVSTKANRDAVND